MNLSSILAPESKPKLMRNESHPDKVLVTPFVDKSTGVPKTDLQMRPIGSIMIAQEKVTLNGGFMNASTRYAFLSGTVEFLESLIKRHKLEHGSDIPGQIIVLESLNPFFEGQQPKINPSTKAPIGFTVNDKFYPVYYQTRFTEDMNAKDKTIRSTEEAMDWLNARNMQAVAAKAGAAIVETSNIPVTETAGA